MKKLIILTIFSIFFTAGCSFIPRLTMDSPNSVPQQTDRSKGKEVCKGKVEMNEQGEIVSCSKGYYRYDENYAKKERRYTWKEKLANIVRNTAGWLVIVMILIVIFLPATGAFIIGRVVEGTVGMASTVAKRMMNAIQKTRKQGKNLDDALSTELDEKDKQYIRQVKDKENIK